MHLEEHGGERAAGWGAAERGRLEDGVLETAKSKHTAGRHALQPLQPLAHHQVQPIHLPCIQLCLRTACPAPFFLQQQVAEDNFRF